MKFLLLLMALTVMVPAGTQNSARNFSPPNAVDSLIDAHPIALPTIKPADFRSTESPVPQPENTDTSTSLTKASAFRVQVDALSDLDSAQSRKTFLEQTLGEKVDVIFDPPYYKLRLGGFATR